MSALDAVAPPRSDAGGPITSGDLISELDVAYGPELTLPDGTSPRQIGDIYYPSGTERLPVLVEAHGGAFRAGTRTSHTTLARAIASQGYLVFNVDYYVDAAARDLLLSHEDFALAVQFIKSHPRADPTRVGVFGTSAGAFMVMSFCAAGVTPLGDAIRAGISWSGELVAGPDGTWVFPPTASSAPCLVAGYGDVDNPTTASAGYRDYEQPAPEVESEAEYLSYQAFVDAGVSGTELFWLREDGHGLSLQGEPAAREASLRFLEARLAGR